MEYIKFTHITLKTLFDNGQISRFKSEIANISEKDKMLYIQYLRHRIKLAIRQKFPDIPQKHLRRRLDYIVRKEFAFAYPCLNNVEIYMQNYYRFLNEGASSLSAERQCCK